MSAFKLALGKEAAITKVCVPHLLLNEHFLNADSPSILHLSGDWTTLIRPSQWSHAGRPIMNIIFTALLLLLSLSTSATLLSLLIISLLVFVPHKAGEGVALNELPRLVRYLMIVIERGTPGSFL